MSMIIFTPEKKVVHLDLEEYSLQGVPVNSFVYQSANKGLDPIAWFFTNKGTCWRRVSIDEIPKEFKLALVLLGVTL